MKLGTVILATAAYAGSSAAMAQVAIPEGTKVRVRLEQAISSATAEAGQPVQLSVTDNVKVGDTVVIPQGATAVGSIVQAVPKRRMGRTGKLDFSVERVVAADGTSIPLRYAITKKEGGSHAVTTGVLTAGAAVVFWPAAPVFLLMKGKDVTVNKGMVIDVFTDQKFALKAATAPAMAPPAPAPAPSAPVLLASTTQPGPATAQNSAVTITSDPAGAEVEVDGAFVGSTPSTVQMTPGLHNISVRRGTLQWRRALQVQPGSSANVVAVLGR